MSISSHKLELENKFKKIHTDISKKFDRDIIPQLERYIAIPNKSPQFDANWKARGYMDQAMQLIIHWCEQQSIQGMKLELFEDEQRTPLLFIEIDGNNDGEINDTILMYGHMDKQPEMRGWDDDLGPWTPVLKDGKLYGRGGADDGYAVFSSLTAIAMLQQHHIPHANIKIIIEGSEESGCCDLPHYLQQLKSRIGQPNLIICLDSGAGNYDQLWGTTSLRGFVGGELHIDILREGIHSGIGSGIVPSTMMILRELLDRIEDKHSGQLSLKPLHVDIPNSRKKEVELAATILGEAFYTDLPFCQNANPVKEDVKELILNQTWRAALSVTGIDGLPLPADAGNVTIPNLIVKLSIRIPPTCDPDIAANALKQALENDPPFGATISFNPNERADGWQIPDIEDWLIQATDHASHCFFNRPAAYRGEGGSIPFMGMLSELFPHAQFLITGVLGPKSNAHGPNEFLHIDTVKKVTGCVAAVIAHHCERNSE